MRKLLCGLLTLALAVLLPLAALAEGEDYAQQLADKEAQIADLQAENEALQTRVEALEAQLAELTLEPEPTPEPAYQELSKGSNGDAVVQLQERLKALGYLTGKSDGAYGNGTASAVSAFQARAGLSQTGTADAATQEMLFQEDAPKSLDALYETLDYDTNARDPEGYEGTMIKFTGKVLQVMEDDSYVVFRIASKGNYDNVVYAIYPKPEGYKRFLEDDKVSVCGVSAGVYSYTTVRGDTVTIPACLVDTIVLQ